MLTPTHSIYTQAIRYQPDLDVALANLASAIKDSVMILKLSQCEQYF